MALGSSSLNPLSLQHFSFFIKVQCHYHQVMLKVGVLEVGPGKVDSLVCHLGGLAGAHTQKAPVFLLCSVVTVLKFFIIYHWACVLQLSPKGWWSTVVNKGVKCNMWICIFALFLDILFAYSTGDAPWAQNFGEFKNNGSSTRLKASVRSACYIYN